jgi:hypothetical protein
MRSERVFMLVRIDLGARPVGERKQQRTETSLHDAVQPRLLEFHDLAYALRPPSFRRLFSRQGATLEAELARDSAYKMPWSHAVLRALELESSRQGVQRARLLERLGIDAGELDAALRVLAETAQIVKTRGKWQPRQVINVNTAQNRARAHALKVRWTEAALSRIRAGAPGNYGYSLFSVSREAGSAQTRLLHAQTAPP